MVFHLSINGLLACTKHIRSCDLLYIRAHDMSGDLLLIWPHETRLPDSLAYASCFLGSHVSPIMGFTYGTFDLELYKLNIMDCIYDTLHHLHLHSQSASMELIFANITTTPTHLPLPLTLNCESLLKSCSPKEKYITCITVALQNLASQSRAMLWDNCQKGPLL